MKPLISVIMPVYNCEKTVETAIDSILNQTYENIEIIVVVDESTDKSEEIVRAIAKENSKVLCVKGEEDPERFDRKLGRNINAGYSARNIGLQHARGEYITFQDADDASFLNRIEIQYELLKKYEATHVTVDWMPYMEEYLGKKFDSERYFKEHPESVMIPLELYKLSRKTKGLIPKYFPALNTQIPFHWKRTRWINKLFFGSLLPYPGAANCSLFKREVLKKIKFRKLGERVWPTFMGRGADRDFNFQIAEMFKNSYVFFIPLFLWRQEKADERYGDSKKYII